MLETLRDAYGVISALGFPFVLFLLLFGSYAGIYYWGNAIRAERVDAKAREKELKDIIAAQQAREERMMDQLFETAVLVKENARRVSR